MIIDRANLNTVFTGFKGVYQKGFDEAETAYLKVAMKVQSGTAQEIYGWLGQFPGLREWIGPRVVKNLMVHGFTLENKIFESTVSVPRTTIEDDSYGVFTPAFQELGSAAAKHPDELVFSLLGTGFTKLCYDGQYFFDTDHPVGAEGAVASASNFGGGSGEPWYLLDTSRAMRPLIYQERIPYNLTTKNQESDDNVFFNDTYIYGVRARSNAGFGLWQLAYASKQTLNAANYSAARAAMQLLKGDEGRPLSVKPTLLVVGPTLEEAALKLINTATLENGESNPWHNTVEIIVTPWAA